MTGFHNQTIYTIDDNEICEKCANAEPFKGTRVFKEGGYICPPHGIPRKDQCSKFTPKETKF